MKACKKHWIRALVLLLAGGLILSACGPTEAPEAMSTEMPAEAAQVEATAAPTEVPPTPAPSYMIDEYADRYGGVFNVVETSPPPTLDSQGSTSIAVSVVNQQIMERLLSFDASFQVQPELAESWEVSDDGLTYTFHLKKGVTFHNGKPMTSADVMASMKRFLEVTARTAAFALMTSYDAPDDFTFVTTLSAPSATWLDTLASPSSDLIIFPAEIIEGKPKGEIDATDLIGTGPYMVVEYVPDQYLHLKRFEGYVPYDPDEFPKSGLAGAKLAYFDELIIHYVTDPSAQVAGLEVGDFDMIVAPAAEIDRFEADPNIKIAITKPSSGNYILFNHANEWSSNLKFREAVLAVRDPETLLMAQTGGRKDQFDLNASLWPETSVFYFDDEYSKQRYNQQDPELAKELLAEIGYNGEEIVLASWGGNSEKHMLTLCDELREIGVNCKVDNYDWPGLTAAWAETTGWHISTTNYLTPESVSPEGNGVYWDSSSNNAVRCHYSNPTMDEIFKRLYAAPTSDERMEILKELQTFFWQDLPNMKNGQLYEVRALRQDIMDWVGYPRGSALYGIWREK